MHISFSGGARGLHHRGRQSRDRGQQRARRLARILDEELVEDDKARHGLDDGHGTRHHARVVPAARGKRTRGAVVLRRLLRLGNRRGRLEANPKRFIVSRLDATSREAQTPHTHLK